MLETTNNTTFTLDETLVEDIVKRATHTKAMADYMITPNIDKETYQRVFNLGYAMDQAQEIVRQIGYLHDEGEWNFGQIRTSLYDMPVGTLDPITSRVDTSTLTQWILNPKLLDTYLQDHAEDLLRCISDQARRTEGEATRALHDYKRDIMNNFAADNMDAATAVEKLTGQTQFIAYHIMAEILPGITVIRDSLEARYLYIQGKGAWESEDAMKALAPLTASDLSEVAWEEWPF